ncbi:MAG: hypothetical protein ACR2N5_08280 [Solirubrobacterales bacterium]
MSIQRGRAIMQPARRTVVAVVAAAGLLAFAGFSTSTADARGLILGLQDPVFGSDDEAEQSLWFDRAADTGAGLVQLGATWARIAPGSPSGGFDPRDPADPEYDWSDVDSEVRAAAERGLTPLLHVAEAPGWAEGKNRPAGFGVPEGKDRSQAPGGTWKPRLAALEDFAVAIAQRYSGSFVDPADPGAGPLPRVRHFQLWREPNLAAHLNPRYEGGKPYAAIHYRKMTRSFWNAVHSVNDGNKVIGGGTAPYGDLKRRGRRTPPARFWRDVLCLKGKKLKKAKCNKPAKFDIAGHNPINVGGPNRAALNPDDVSTPDLAKIKRVLRAAERSGRVRPSGKKQIWATEIWWDSRPPDPDAVSPERQAQRLAEALYVLWDQGARAVVWRLIRDQAPPPTFTAWSAGLYFADGTAKPALSAFEFPFVARPTSESRARVWGMAPEKGSVVIERARSGGWKKIAKTKAGGDRVFERRVKVPTGKKLRARVGDETSLAFKVVPAPGRGS